MKVHLKILCKLVIILTFCDAIGAQNEVMVDVKQGEENGITAICKKSNNDMIIRWAPANEGVWLKSLQGIVWIERNTFSSFSERNDSTTVVLIDTLRPWSISKIEREMIAHPHRKDYVIAGSLLYGEWESMDTTRQEINMEDIANRHVELVNRYSNAMLLADLSKDGASAMGLRFVDENAPDANYISYRITLYLNDGTYYQTTALYNKAMNIVAVPRIEDSEELDGKVRLSWQRSGHEKYFSAYYVERSKDGKIYERLNELPFINALDAKETFGITPISFTAEAENGFPYYYRIIGLDAFGDESMPSEPILLTSRDLTPPPAPQGAEATYQDDNTMLIRWTQDSVPEDFRGFIVMKGDAFNGTYISITDTLLADRRTYVDSGKMTYGATYYKLCAVDRSGNSVCTQPIYGAMVDSIPPSQPLGLTGEIDSSGVVTLTWNKNVEEDLDGYYVYFSNGADNVFQRLNNQPISRNNWLDTISLGTLTKEIYYKVTAVDIRSNVSDFSEAAKLYKPDTIPPAAALLKSYNITEEGIEIIWVNSNSRDVEMHELRRRTEEDDEWKVIGTYYNYEDRHTDIEMKAGMKYEYDISAVDNAGLRSKPTRTFQLVYPRKLKDLDLTMEIRQAEDGVILELWIDEDPKLISNIWIYRKINEGPYRKLSVIGDPENLMVEDKNVQNEHTYTYKYKVVFKSGLQSDYSDEYVTLYSTNKK